MDSKGASQGSPLPSFLFLSHRFTLELDTLIQGFSGRKPEWNPLSDVSVYVALTLPLCPLVLTMSWTPISAFGQFRSRPGTF
jgi:hypothetical protein